MWWSLGLMVWGSRGRKLWTIDERGLRAVRRMLNTESTESTADTESRETAQAISSYLRRRTLERCRLTPISIFGGMTSGSMGGSTTRWRRCAGIFFRRILNQSWGAE